MAKKNTLILLSAGAAALLAGSVMWFFDSAAAKQRWQQAPDPTAGQGGPGFGRGPAPVPLPDFAYVPAFHKDAATVTNTELLKYYAKQLPLDKKPTLQDWQALVAAMPKDVPGSKPLTLPLGRGHFVMAMCADPQGNLWIGTEGEGIFRYNPEKPAEDQWAQFTTKDGLGDDYGYAMACDQQGRVWVGHLNHGVSVFNGERWQTYEVVGGLSRPDTLNGPLGERIFEIAVAPDFAVSPTPPVFHDWLTEKDSPMAGSVWMASSAGLAIYFPSTDTWSYVTRAEGMPSDQANAIAFGTDGTVYIGTQCDGIAIAKPDDKYQSWKQVTAANPTPHAVDGKIVDFPVPTVGAGSGIPTDLINDILVARDGTVYVATTLGLAWSTDKGNSWQYVRGADWVDKVKNRYGGPPQGWQAPSAASNPGILSEDYTTVLAENGEGKILVGHRGAAGDVIARGKSDDAAITKVGTSENAYVTAYVPLVGTSNSYRGTYGFGISADQTDRVEIAGLVASSTGGGSPRGKLPNGGVAPTVTQFQKFNRKLSEQLPLNLGSRLVLSSGEDWTTQGDWIGRYGRQYGVLCGSNAPSDDKFINASGFLAKAEFDPAFSSPNDRVRAWLEGYSSNHPSSLWNPIIGARRQSIWDDHGEGYPLTQQGPNLWVTLPLPEGLYRISLYFFPYRGHEHALSRNYRDFVIRTGVRSSPLEVTSVDVSRVSHFQGGVYKQFTLKGGAAYTFKIDRNFSYNTIIDGVFIDRLQGPKAEREFSTLAAMGRVKYHPPVLSDINLSSAAQNLLSAWLPSENRPALIGALTYAEHILRYRATAVTDPSVSSLLRWSVPLWNKEDRTEWNETMAEGWRSFLDANPNYANRLSTQPK